MFILFSVVVGHARAASSRAKEKKREWKRGVPMVGRQITMRRRYKAQYASSDYQRPQCQSSASAARLTEAMRPHGGRPDARCMSRATPNGATTSTPSNKEAIWSIW